MLKILLPLSLAISVASAVPILTVGPISVSGGGTYYESLGDSSVIESFSGTNGIDSVFMSGGGEGGPDGGIGFGDATPADVFGGSASIDAVGSSYFSFSLASGMLTIDNSVGTAIASADIVGYANITNIVYDNPEVPELGYTETFAIVPTAEPGTAWLLLAGLAALIVMRSKRPTTSLSTSEPSSALE